MAAIAPPVTPAAPAGTAPERILARGTTFVLPVDMPDPVSVIPMMTQCNRHRSSVQP
jgi:hypothetical protein